MTLDIHLCVSSWIYNWQFT